MNLRRNNLRLSFVASNSPKAQSARRTLRALYGSVPIAEADAIVAIGGDGFMLQTLRRHMKRTLPIFGLNRGTVGFLMNEFREEKLIQRIKSAELVTLHPLRMIASRAKGRPRVAYALNEVSVLRQTRQAANVRISVDGRVRIDPLVCDGVLVSTPAGSTAYNLSVHGPILPMGAEALALTPISAFRPRQWRGAILPRNAKIRFDILESDKRPVSAVADHTEVRDVTSVEIEEDRTTKIHLLFDPEHNLEDRILNEQFIS
jgi:NAD+ kinase